LKDTDAAVRKEATGALESICRRLGRDDDTPWKITDPPVIPALIEALGDKESNVRLEAARALWHINDAASIPALVTALGDTDSQVRHIAHNTLNNLRDASAIPGVAAMLSSDRQEAREYAAAVLQMIGDNTAVPALLETMKRGTLPVDTAAEIISHIRDASSTPLLVAALQEEREEVREGAAKALGTRGISDAAAVPALIAALKDEGAGVRVSAALSLGMIGHASAIPVLIEKLNAAGGMGLASGVALGLIGEVSAVPALLASLQGDHFESSCHRYIAEALVNIALMRFPAKT